MSQEQQQKKQLVETPISQYLATLERRQAKRDLLFSSPTSGMSLSPESPKGQQGVNKIRQQLRFDDATFIQSNDQTVMNSPPPPPQSVPLLTHNPQNPRDRLIHTSTGSVMALANVRNKNNSGSSNSSTTNPMKRPRYSFEGHDQEEDYIKNNCKLEKNLRQISGELVQARGLITKLERQKMDLMMEKYHESLNHDKLAREMRIKSRDAVEKAEVLEKDHDALTKQVEELKNELRWQTSQYKEKILAMESKVSKLQSENVELKQQYEEEKLDQSDAIKKMSVSLQETKEGSDKWSNECQKLKDQLELKNTQQAKYMEEIKGSSKFFRTSEVKPESDESTESQIQSLQQSVKKYENLFVKEQIDNAKLASQIAKLTEENGFLKNSMNKELLLEEQIASLETKLEYQQNLAKSKAEIEVERDNMKEKLKLWVGVAQNVDSQLTTPQNFTIFLSKMQTELVQMRHENTTLSCRVDGLNRDINRLQSELGIARLNESTKKDECEKLNSDLKKLNGRLTFVTKDRDGLKSLKESYELEFVRNDGNISPALKERVDQLENLVMEYEQAINANPVAGKTCFECEKRMDLVNELRSELEKARSGHYQDASTFGDMTMTGDGNTTGIKVVAFGNNPSSLSMDVRIKELCDENEKLKNRIRQLEDRSMVGPNDTVVTQGNKIMEEQIRTLERKNQILSEAYDYETQQLQTALNKLFGFHIILVREPQSQFRLQSVYGSGQEDELVFQEAENSDMMLLETPVLDHFRDDIERFLLREGSIPAFLATVTIGFSQGQVQPSSDASQLPSSQQSSAASSGETVTINPTNPPSNRKMVEVQVAGQTDEEESDIEEGVEEEQEEAEVDENEEEEDEHYNSEDEIEEEEDEEDEGHEEFQSNRQRRGNNDSPNDVVCIDSD